MAFILDQLNGLPCCSWEERPPSSVQVPVALECYLPYECLQLDIRGTF